jgi:hypothetical protein
MKAGRKPKENRTHLKSDILRFSGVKKYQLIENGRTFAIQQGIEITSDRQLEILGRNVIANHINEVFGIGVNVMEVE